MTMSMPPISAEPKGAGAKVSSFGFWKRICGVGSGILKGNDCVVCGV